MATLEELLKRLDLSKFLPQFQAQGIDLAAAKALSEADLEKLGVNTMGARRKLHLALQQASNAPAAPAAPPAPGPPRPPAAAAAPAVTPAAPAPAVAKPKGAPAALAAAAALANVPTQYRSGFKTTETEFKNFVQSIQTVCQRYYEVEVDWPGLISTTVQASAESEESKGELNEKSAATRLSEAFTLNYKLQHFLDDGIKRIFAVGLDSGYVREHKATFTRMQTNFAKRVPVNKIIIKPGPVKLEIDWFEFTPEGIVWEVSCKEIAEQKYQSVGGGDNVRLQFTQHLGNDNEPARLLTMALRYDNGRVEPASLFKLKEIVSKPGFPVDTFIHAESKTTALHMTCRIPWLNSTKILLAAGANPNARNENGETPFYLIAESGLCYTNQAYRGQDHLIKVAMELLTCGRLDPNIADKDGVTPLHNAMYSGFYDLAYEIIKNCPTLDLSLKDKQGLTVLDLAVRNDVLAVIQAVEAYTGGPPGAKPAAKPPAAPAATGGGGGGGGTDKEMATLMVYMAEVLADIAEDCRRGGQAGKLRQMVYNIKKSHQL